MQRGTLISFEGIDGSGKTKHAQALTKALRDRGRKVLLCKDPGTTSLGESLKRMVQGGEVEASPHAKTWLMMAALADLHDTVVRPSLDAGLVVIADRYADSSVAYRPELDGRMTPGRVSALAHSIIRGAWPDLTFYCKGGGRCGREQGDGERWTRNAKTMRSIEERYDAWFQDVAEFRPERSVLSVDTTGAFDVVHEHVLDATIKFLL